MKELSKEKRKSTIERFNEKIKVNPHTSCWEWQGKQI